MCDCNKNRDASPTGYGYANQAQQAQSLTQREEARAAAMAQAQARNGYAATPTGVTQSFALQDSAGHTQTFGSRLEALAEQARSGGRIVA